METGTVLEKFYRATGIPLSQYHADTYEQKAAFGSFRPDIAFEIMKPRLPVCPQAAYTITPDYFFCGVLRLRDDILVLGPVLSYECTGKQARNVLNELGVSLSLTDSLLRWFHKAPYYTVPRVRGMINLLGMLLGEAEPVEAAYLPYKPIEKNSTEPPFTSLEFIPAVDSSFEDRLLSCIEYGNTEELERTLEEVNSFNMNLPDFEVNTTRTFQIVFVVSTTLASTSAKQGGLAEGICQVLSDKYLSKVETIERDSDFNLLWRQMLLEFTRLTARSRRMNSHSALVTKICKDVQAHLYDKITVTGIAGRLSASIPHLCRHFKQETGMTIVHYIQQQKTEECSRLLEATQLPLAHIAMQMGFSSQNYLHRVFKKQTGMTPSAYREQHLR
jgi:AraC-like DNA-binding protein